MIKIAFIIFCALLQCQELARAQTRKTESWYFQTALGSASIHYPEAIKKAAAHFDQASGSFFYDYKLNIDFPGFYFPFSDKSIWGFNLNWLIESDAIEGFNEEFHIIAPTGSISFMRFFSTRIGQGFLVRFDSGISLVSARSLIVTYETISETDFTTYETKQKFNYLGLGFLAGIGYAVPINDKTSILFEVKGSLRGLDFNGEKHLENLSFSGGLFF